MTRLHHSLPGFVVLALTMLTLGSLARADNNYVLIQMPRGVSVELPKNWYPIRENERVTLDASTQANAERAGEYVNSELPVAANYYDAAGKTAAMMNVRYYPEQTVTQGELRAATAAEVKEIDALMKGMLQQSGQVSGFRVLEWRGTTRVTLPSGVALLCEYKRSPLKNNGNFVVRLVRVMNGPRSFTLTVSYREDQEVWMRPITDRIIRTLRF